MFSNLLFTVLAIILHYIALPNLTALLNKPINEVQLKDIKFYMLELLNFSYMMINSCSIFYCEQNVLLLYLELIFKHVNCVLFAGKHRMKNQTKTISYAVAITCTPAQFFSIPHIPHIQAHRLNIVDVITDIFYHFWYVVCVMCNTKI